MGTEETNTALICGQKKQTYLEWELENNPHVYDKPRCNEFIDRQTLTHVICNVNPPDDVDLEVFQKVVDVIAETLDLFPYFKVSAQPRADLELLEAAGFEI